VYFGIAAVFVLSVGLSYALTGLARRIGLRFPKFVDMPRPGELQRLPMPRTAGYAVIATFIVAVAISLPFFPRFSDEYPRLLGLVLGGLLIVPFALLDDSQRLPPLPQLAYQVLLAVVALASGTTLSSLANPFGGPFLVPEYVVIPLTLVWFVGMINTLNFLDTMDGLAAGVTGIASLVLCIRALGQGQISIAILCLALAGACLGFLPRNFSRSKIILGTSGSMFLGYALATLGVIGGAKAATTLMVLAIPILDTALVVSRRLLAGRSPFRGGDSAHLPHQLLLMGVPQPAIIGSLYALCIFLGVMALALTPMQKLVAFAVMAGALGLAVGAIAWRTRGPGSESNDRTNGKGCAGQATTNPGA
jgi:UDP-GlcNAc:undecaprenyl-phosphate/decaprenyl-phosphate GlcNAc-1-phosphate transferase